MTFLCHRDEVGYDNDLMISKHLSRIFKVKKELEILKESFLPREWYHRLRRMCKKTFHLPMLKGGQS